MDILNLSDFEVCDCDKNFIETEVPDYPQEILDNILAYAVENKIIEDELQLVTYLIQKLWVL